MVTLAVMSDLLPDGLEGDRPEWGEKRVAEVIMRATGTNERSLSEFYSVHNLFVIVQDPNPFSSGFTELRT